MAIYRRYLRYSEYDRLRHSKRFKAFLARKSTDLAGTATQYAVGTIVDTLSRTRYVTATSSNFEVADGPLVFAISGSATVPAPFRLDTRYYVAEKYNETSFSLALEPGGEPIIVTSAASGTVTIGPSADRMSIYELLRQYEAKYISAEDDIDDLVG